MHNLFMYLKQIRQFVATSSAETSQPLLVRHLFGIISMIKEIMSRCQFCVPHQSELMHKKTNKKKHTPISFIDPKRKPYLSVKRVN